MSAEQILGFIARSTLAPSVHNVQPARWRVDENGATLFEDVSRRLAVADPNGHDAAMSLGAAAEGFCLAASKAGIRATIMPALPGSVPAGHKPVASLRFDGHSQPDPLAQAVEARQSWRGVFSPALDEDRHAAGTLAARDATVLAKPSMVRDIAHRLDTASLGFMCADPFRRELVSWMRLSRRHPRWSRDGLNAEAMAMGRIEALAAGFVLGPGFTLLRRVGLAKPLLSEATKTASAAAIVLFHRPAGEDRFISGAYFYRLWLRIEAAGFGAAVLAVLADDPASSEWLARTASLPSGQRLVSAFRIGRRTARPAYARARLPIGDILLPGS